MIRTSPVMTQKQPSIFVAIGYKEIYDDFATANPSEFIKDIPTVAIVKFVAEQYANVIYAVSDWKRQRLDVMNMRRYLPAKTKKKLSDYVKNWERKGNHVFLFGHEGCMMLYRLALQNYTPLEPDDDYVDLCEDEYESVYKALLYCNQVWTDGQLDENDKEFVDMSIKMDMPVVEYKSFKDFRPQLYKANQFFTFCESDPVYQTYLPYYCSDVLATSWADYERRIFGIYESSIKSPVITYKEHGNPTFVKQFVISDDDPELYSLWDDAKVADRYLRKKFLFSLNDEQCIVMNANLIVDKLYQGLKFDIFASIKKHNLPNHSGKSVKSFDDFTSEYGQYFSEKHLLGDLMSKTYSGFDVVLLKEEDIKLVFGDATPDLYIRDNDNLFLFEYKDQLVKNDIRFEEDASKIRAFVLDRLCKDDGEKRKGGGQLLNTLDLILNQGVMNQFDPDVTGVKQIFPIIVITDRAFSALGINRAVLEEFDRILKEKYKFEQPVMIFNPVVVHIDTLFALSTRLHNKTFTLQGVLTDYILNNWLNMTPFDSFAYDHYRESNAQRQEGITFLLTDVVENVSKRTYNSLIMKE